MTRRAIVAAAIRPSRVVPAPVRYVAGVDWGFGISYSVAQLRSSNDQVLSQLADDLGRSARDTCDTMVSELFRCATPQVGISSSKP